MLCGTRSFSDIDDRSGRASSPRPKLSKLKQSLSLDRGRKQTSNPYSNEGLDKFEKLIAELEAKKEEVLLKKKGHSSTIVRFKYNSDTEDWIPIIVRLQPEEAKKESSKEKLIRASTTEEKEVIKQVAGNKKVEKSSMYRWIIDVQQYFWATMIALVLVSCCCFILGRAFVVCSATVLWYMVPMMNSESWSGSWDLRVYGKRLISDKWLGGRNLGVAPSSSSSSSSLNVKKMGSDHARLVSNHRRSTVK